MKGGIYRVKTHGRYYWQVRFGKTTFTRASKTEAERILTGLRYETDRGTFDPRDYRKDQPLAFNRLADKWLEYKKAMVRPGSFRNIRLPDAAADYGCSPGDGPCGFGNGCQDRKSGMDAPPGGGCASRHGHGAEMDHGNDRKE